MVAQPPEDVKRLSRIFENVLDRPFSLLGQRARLVTIPVLLIEFSDERCNLMRGDRVLAGHRIAGNVEHDLVNIRIPSSPVNMGNRSVMVHHFGVDKLAIPVGVPMDLGVLKILVSVLKNCPLHLGR
jgi:hypothetical protein